MTTPIRIWASGKASIIPTTDPQWDEGFDYLAATNEGKPLTDNHDFVFKVITEAIAAIQEKPIDDISNLNHIKNPQFLANRLGNALAGENYAANAEIVDGWLAGASGCNGVTMTASGITFTAGSMVYKYAKANGQLLADMKASILAPDGSILTDPVYVALTETATDFVVEVKLQAITDKTAIRSVKLERGDLSKHEILSFSESVSSSLGIPRSYASGDSVELGGGLVLKWGSANYKASDGAAGSIHTFSQGFKANTIAVFTCDAGVKVLSTAAAPIDKDSFTLWMKLPGSGAFENGDATFFAIGY